MIKHPARYRVPVAASRKGCEHASMKVLVIHSRDLDKGSTRFRVVNYIPYLQSQGISVDFVNRKEVTAAQAREHDVVLNQKCRIGWWAARTLRSASQRLLFDFDDAIYTRPRKPYGPVVGFRVRRRLDWWLAAADLVTTSSDYLAGYARRITDRIRVIPMAVDVDTWHPSPRAADDRIRIGWAGRPGNLRFLRAIETPLASLLRARPNVSFAVYSGESPDMAVPMEHTPFHAGTEAAFCQSLDIGLLPLDDTAFTRGKSPIKAIQYLACGVPVVGNVIGAGREIVTNDVGLDVSDHGGWLDALIQLVDNAALRRQLGDAGRARIVARHNLATSSTLLLDAITGNRS